MREVVREEESGISRREPRSERLVVAQQRAELKALRELDKQPAPSQIPEDEEDYPTVSPTTNPNTIDPWNSVFVGPFSDDEEE